MSAMRRLAPGLVVLGCVSIHYNLSAQQADEATLQRYSRQAEEALARKDPETALEALEKLAHLSPNNAEVFANLGAVYYTGGQYTQASEAFQRALRLNPKLPNAPLMLGMCDAELGRSKEALPVLEPAFRHPPNDEMGRAIGFKLVAIYSALDQPAKALETIEALLKRYPNDPEILYRASHFYGNRALGTMMRLVEVAPQSPWKRMAFAEALEGEKRYDLAIIEYRKVIAAEPRMAGVHYRLGRALLLKAPDSEESRDEALKEFQLDLSIDPRNSAAQYEMGEIYRRRGEFQSAVDHFSRAIEMDPSVEDAQIALARTLLHLHRTKESLPHLLAAIRLNPQNEVSHFLLASAYRSLGNSAAYQNEMELYRRYHTQPYANETGELLPGAVTNPEVTRQTLGSEAAPR